MSPVALVTGASSGIGAAIARDLARRGWTTVLVARRHDALDRLAATIVAEGGPAPFVIPQDLSDRGAGETLNRTLAAEGAQVAVLINNAGYGLLGPATMRDRDEQLGIIDLNIRSLTDLTLRFLPDLKATRGVILNVASVAAFSPGPGMAVYYASKAFVLSFSEALHAELKPDGVGVTALCPGLTETEFGTRAGMGAQTFGLLRTATAESVAAAGLDALFKRRRVVVPGFGNKIGAWLGPRIPHALSLPLIARAQGTRRPS